MNCPNCRHPLDRIRYADVNVLQCGLCRGHLVENHRIKTIEQKRDKDLVALGAEVEEINQVDTVEAIRCPRCRDRMIKKEIRAQRKFCVNECRNCSFVWLDGGELAEIQLEFGTSEQTAEVNRMRERLASMSDAERSAYEERMANLIERGTEMELMQAATDELVHQFYYGCFRIGRFG